MKPPRAFTAEDADQRIPPLLTLVMMAIRSEREACRVPVRILLDTRTHTAVAAFLGAPTIDKLFGLPVQTNMSENAQPITIESEPRPYE